MSIDEAYLDVTKNKLGIKSAVKIARLVQEDIWQELHLTTSTGVSYNKFLAKMASDYQKPHGLTVILPANVTVRLQITVSSLYHKYIVSLGLVETVQFIILIPSPPSLDLTSIFDTESFHDNLI